MVEIFIIRLTSHNKSNKVKTGYLGNDTTIAPDLTIKIVDDAKRDDHFDHLVFFMSSRYARHIAQKVCNDIANKFKSSKVDYDIKTMNISQDQLNKMLSNQWKYPST